MNQSEEQQLFQLNQSQLRKTLKRNAQVNQQQNINSNGDQMLNQQPQQQQENKGLRRNVQPQQYQILSNQGDDQLIKSDQQNILIPDEQTKLIQQDNQLQNQVIGQQLQQQQIKDDYVKKFEEEPILVQIRSDFIANVDRQTRQEPFLYNIQNTGILGLESKRVDKSFIQNIQAKERLQTAVLQDQVQETFENFDEQLKLDGVYVSQQEKHLKQQNQNRFEQRLFEESRNKCKAICGEFCIGKCKIDWWRADNQELILDNQAFTHKNQRIITLSIEENPAFQTIQKNATLCDRWNQHKSQQFVLDLAIGRLQLYSHPAFSEEEIFAGQLIRMLQYYKKQIQLTLIPHIRHQIQQQQQQHNELRSLQRQPYKEIELIEKKLHELNLKYNEEIQGMQKLMKMIYDKWMEIKDKRNFNKYNSSYVKLGVRQFQSLENTAETEFFLLREENLSQQFDGNPLPQQELQRRAKLQNIMANITIYINGQKVGQTRNVRLQWPSMEMVFDELFSIHLYTMPSSIQLRVSFENFLFSKEYLAHVDIDIPGEKVFTLTSAPAIYGEALFFKESQDSIQKKKARELQKQKLQRQIDLIRQKKKKIISQKEIQKHLKIEEAGNPQEDEVQDQTHLFEDENFNQDEEEEKVKLLQEMQNEEQIQSDYEKLFGEVYEIEGRIVYRGEWRGTGNKMPPKTISDQKRHLPFVKKNQLLNTQSEQQINYIDVNDPREKLKILQLERQKHLDFSDVIYQEQLAPYNNISSIRAYLHKIRNINPDLFDKYVEIPIKEEDIINNQRLCKLIEDYEKQQFELELKDTMAFSKLLGQQKEFIQTRQQFVDDVAFIGQIQFPQKAQTLDRINQILKTVRQRIKTDKMGKEENEEISLFSNLQSVIKEFKFDAQINPFQLCLQTIFTQKRKLGPQRVKEDKKQANLLQQIDVITAIICAHNVPVRSSQFFSLQEIIKQRRDRQQIIQPLPMYGGDIMNMQRTGGMGNLFQQSMGNQQLSVMNQQIQQLNQEDEEINRLKRVYSCVQLRLLQEYIQDQIELSDCQEGHNPEFNQVKTLTLKSKSKNVNFSPQQIMSEKNILQITLFDILGDIQTRAEDRTKFNLSVQKYFLGGISIPLVSLLSNGKLEANFRIERPIILFGYFTMQESLFGAARERLGQNDIPTNITDPATPTYLSLNITTDPPIEYPVEISETVCSPGFEPPQLLMFAEKFVSDIKKQYPILNSRHFRIWGQNICQQSVFLCRFLRPLAPYMAKQDSLNDELIFQKVARFVSLIPFKQDTDLFNSMGDVYCTSQQFLDLRGGNFEEHAFLLCNYFNYLDEKMGRGETIKSYVLVGKGVPEGKTSYVLRRNTQNNQVEIWNAQYGEPYNFSNQQEDQKFCMFTIQKRRVAHEKIFDEICPLFQVGCVISAENIYINIQSEDHPSTIMYDFENVKNWRPFLGEKAMQQFFPNGIKSIIAENIIYEEIEEGFCEKLELNIEKYICDKIHSYRRNPDDGSAPMLTMIDRQFIISYLIQIGFIKNKCNIRQRKAFNSFGKLQILNEDFRLKCNFIIYSQIIFI